MKRTSVFSLNLLMLHILVLAYACTLIFPHVLQTTTLENYRGMQEWNFGFFGYCFLIISIITGTFALSKRRFLPSDFFVVLYLLVVILPFIALYSSSGYITDEMLPVSFIILSAPLLIMISARNIPFNFPNIVLLSENKVIFILMSLTIICVVFSYFIAPSSASFSMETSYARRLEGREILDGYFLGGYLLSMTINMFIPLYAFIAGYTKRNAFLLISIVFALFFFWLLGIKATFLYLAVAYTTGRLFLDGKLHRLPYYILTAMLLLFLIFLVEWWTTGYSFVADYFFRRLFSLGVQIQGYYLDLIIHNPPLDWNFFIGSNNPEFFVTYYVGEYYANNPLTNMNSNCFLYAFGQKGLLGYLSSIVIVPFIFLILDKIYKTRQAPICIFLGFIFATLVLEQAYTTALLSSGVAIMTVLVFLMRIRTLRNNKNTKAMILRGSKS
jgi:hypothetical protein